ncbi:MAG TPA: hypothetical protein VNY05_17915 [Candidatus Acidoferrales bacterium]|nr:hypothetical protein [Candidatus Acidoferrales bacterium]
MEGEKLTAIIQTLKYHGRDRTRARDLHPLSNPWTAASLGDKIDGRVQQGFKIEQKATEVEQCASRFQVNQEINVTTFVVVSPRDRSENPNVAGASMPGYQQDLVPFPVPKFLESHGASESNGIKTGRPALVVAPPLSNRHAAGGNLARADQQPVPVGAWIGWGVEPGSWLANDALPGPGAVRAAPLPGACYR